MLGREAELAEVTACLDDDRAVFVAGESGVGKTELLRAAASASGRRVFEGGALATLSWMNHLPLRRALGDRIGEGDASAIARRVEAAVGPGVLLLDDLQWCDPATMDVIGLLTGRVALLAGVRRGEPGAEAALEPLRAAGFAEVALDPLLPAASTELARRLRPDLSDAAIQRLVRRSGGNPLLLHELSATGEPSASLRFALEARLRALGAAARDAFGLLALAGRPLEVDVLGREAVGSLVDAGLAIAQPPGIGVRHALLAEVAAGALAPEDRQRLHARLARVAATPGEAARHHLQADERDLAYVAALRAAEGAVRPGERASHLAVAASCATGPDADALRLDAARALDEAQDWRGVNAVLDELESEDHESLAWAALLRARGAWVAGDEDALRSALADGLALVGGSGTEIEVRLRIERSRIPIFLDGDRDGGIRMAREARDLAHTAGVDEPRADYLLGTALFAADDPAAEAYLEAAITGARAARDTQTEFAAANNLVSFHESAGTPARGREVATEMAARAQAMGLGHWERAFQAMAANLDFHAGAYADVLPVSERLLDEPLDARTRDMLVELQCLSLVDIGRVEEAVRRLEAALDDAVPDHRGREQLRWVLAEAALWGGRPARALELAGSCLEGRPPSDPNIPLIQLTRAWACVDLGRSPGPAVGPQDLPLLRAVPQETAALELLHAGESARAAERFGKAAALWAPWHRRGELRCEWARAEAVRRSGDVARAVRLLEALEARVEALGMVPLLMRIHHSLRSAGQRRSAPRSVGPGGLTGRERQVLQLVAEGLTNAQIAARLGTTRRTVVTQVTSACARLGADSRAQAAAMASAVSA